MAPIFMCFCPFLPFTAINKGIRHITYFSLEISLQMPLSSYFISIHPAFSTEYFVLHVHTRFTFHIHILISFLLWWSASISNSPLFHSASLCLVTLFYFLSLATAMQPFVFTATNRILKKNQSVSKLARTVLFPSTDSKSSVFLPCTVCETDWLSSKIFCPLIAIFTVRYFFL